MTPPENTPEPHGDKTMTDKLAEAIASFDRANKSWEKRTGEKIPESARLIDEAVKKYHALPVVDVETLADILRNGWAKYHKGNTTIVGSEMHAIAEAVFATYPDGLRWAK